MKEKGEIVGVMMLVSEIGTEEVALAEEVEVELTDVSEFTDAEMTVDSKGADVGEKETEPEPEVEAASTDGSNNSKVQNMVAAVDEKSEHRLLIRRLEVAALAK